MHLRKMFPSWIPNSAIDGLAVAGWRKLATWPLRSGHPLDLFRYTRRRPVQLYLAAVLMENPSMLGRWIGHRAVRDDRPGDNPLDRAKQ